MPGPWEQYQQAPQQGPWMAYAKPDAGKGLLDQASDFFKSMPRGALLGLVNSTTGMVTPESPAPMTDLEQQIALTPPQERLQAIGVDTEAMHKPEGRAGRFGEAVGAGLGNPLTYAGPGGLPLKLGASVLSSLGSEGAGQATEGTPYEGPARMAGAFAGGAAGVRAFGPDVPKAAVPTGAELKAAADKGYTAARNSGVELDPKAVAAFAAQQSGNLTAGPKYAFSGGQYGTAPKTLAILDELGQPPGGARITAGGIDTLRRRIGDVAGETKDFKPTSDAKAAMVLKRGLDDYLENLPQGSVVAGNGSDYVRATKQANADYAAAQRVGNIEQRLENAKDNYQGQVAGNFASQVKSQLRPILKNQKAQRGYTPDEIAAIRGVNKGSVSSNILSQLGRGGAGVIPILTQVGAGIPTAIMTGGASVIPQTALAAALYGARKGGEALTNRQANKLVEMLAKRSPLYESRVNALPPPDTVTNKAALLRALIAH